MNVAICADDYALTPHISTAIFHLATMGRVSAVSCMTASPFWEEYGQMLQVIADKVDVGLHLTLVDETPLTPMPRTAPDGRLPPIGQLIAKSYLGLLAQDEIAREVEAQMAAFIRVMRRPPAHIDGHLHSHVLPGIRDTVFAAAERLTPRPWLRTVTDDAPLTRRAPFKAFVLNILGKAFTREARARGFVANEGFSGFYDFAARGYAEAFPSFLRDLGPRPLILCHPGTADDDAPLAAARAEEYEFLAGPAFARLMPPDQIVRVSAL